MGTGGGSGSRPDVALRVGLEPASTPAPSLDDRRRASLLRVLLRHLLLLRQLLLLLLLLLVDPAVCAGGAFVRHGAAKRATREGAHQSRTERLGWRSSAVGVRNGSNEGFNALVEVFGFAAGRVRWLFSQSSFVLT